MADSFLGRGWAFPPGFDKADDNKTLMAEGYDDIEQSLEILLSTALGERVMQLDFGCDLSPLLFEAMSATLLTTVRKAIERSILFHERRIKVERISIEATQEEGRLDISVDYTVVAVNSRFNYVYPFYLQEANG